MSKQSIANRESLGKEGRIQTIRSFTNPKIEYEVSLGIPRTCTCKAHTLGGVECKHIAKAEALEAAAEARRPEEARRFVEDFARRIFAPVTKLERLSVAYDLMMDAEFSRHATPALRRHAVRRYRKVANMRGFAI